MRLCIIELIRAYIEKVEGEDTMFGIYYGKYLQEKGLITLQQYDELLKEVQTSRLRMGMMAVIDGLMTEKQADEVNQLQQIQDRRFGDIAVEKGYLTQEDVETLLKKQGDPYLLFVQALNDHGYLSLEEIQDAITAYKKEKHLSASDLEAIKSNDLDQIVSVYMKEPSLPPALKEYIALMARNILRLIDTNLRLEQTERIHSYAADFMAVQELEGAFDCFVGMAGEREAVLALASTFGQEAFSQIDEDSLDAACEFINCNNGLYAVNCSEQDIELELLPPSMYTAPINIQTDGPMYRVPMFISGKQIDLILCMDAKWQIV